MQVITVSKCCKKCALEKHITEFKKCAKDRVENVCRECRKKKKPDVIHSFVDGIEGKICWRCKTWQPLLNYHSNKNISGGKGSYCKPCDKERSSHAQRRQYEKEYYEKNKEHHLAQGRQRYHSNIPYERERAKVYRKNNGDVFRAQSHRRRALEKDAGCYTKKEWRELCAKYNYACLCCGRVEPEIKLTVDHIIPISKGGTNLLDNIQPLCDTCNKNKFTKTIDYRY